MVAPVRHLFTVDEFERMDGVFDPDQRVELLEGEIVEMPPIGPAHASAASRLTEWLIIGLQGRATVRQESPLRLTDRSMPQPDVIVARRRPDFYRAAHPRPPDVLLAVEVSGSSLAVDRTVKRPLYAAAGVAELWIVDLAAGVVEVSTAPGPTGYGALREVRAGDPLAPGAFPDLLIDTRGLLGGSAGP